MVDSSPLEHSADSLAAIFANRSDGITVKTPSELRLELLAWLLDLPPAIDPAQAAQILIGRQSRGESAPVSAFAHAMILEIGRAARCGLPEPRRRRTRALS